MTHKQWKVEKSSSVSFKRIISSGLGLLTLAFLACQIQDPMDEVGPVLVPASQNSEASSWSPYHFDNFRFINMPSPAPAASSFYLEELELLKSEVEKMDDSSNRNRNFWSGGGVFRWQEKAHQLLMKYHQENKVVSIPGSEEAIPVSEPLSAFLLSSLSTAQYDALIACWHFKFSFNRPSPAQMNVGIPNISASQGLPGYPSHHSTLAHISADLLRAFFPEDSVEIDLWRTQHVAAMTQSYAHVASDIEAGRRLAEQVFEPVRLRLAQSRLERLEEIPGELQNINRNYATWISLRRPEEVMDLPGSVLVPSWSDSSSLFIGFRNFPEVLPLGAGFDSELDSLRVFPRLFGKSQTERIRFWLSNPDHASPSLYWNQVARDWLHEKSWSEVRSAQLFSLLHRALHDSHKAAWFYKLLMRYPRPGQFAPEVRKPALNIGEVPNRPAYLSSASTQAAAASFILSRYYPEKSAELNDQWRELSFSEIRAGWNYPFIMSISRQRGRTIGNITLSSAINDL